MISVEIRPIEIAADINSEPRAQKAREPHFQGNVALLFLGDLKGSALSLVFSKQQAQRIEAHHDRTAFVRGNTDR